MTFSESHSTSAWREAASAVTDTQWRKLWRVCVVGLLMKMSIANTAYMKACNYYHRRHRRGGTSSDEQFRMCVYMYVCITACTVQAVI